MVGLIERNVCISHEKWLITLLRNQTFLSAENKIQSHRTKFKKIAEKQALNAAQLSQKLNGVFLKQGNSPFSEKWINEVWRGRPSSGALCEQTTNYTRWNVRLKDKHENRETFPGSRSERPRSVFPRAFHFHPLIPIAHLPWLVSPQRNSRSLESRPEIGIDASRFDTAIFTVNLLRWQLVRGP